MIVSRDEDLTRQFDQWGRLEDTDLLQVGDLEEAYSRMAEWEPLFLLLDCRQIGEGHLKLLRKLRRKFPTLDIILLESPRSDKVRESEKRAGADLFLDLPISERDLKLLLGRRLRLQKFRRVSGMLGKSEALEQIIEMILHISRTDISVLITGESGTGKELVAQTLHSFGKRQKKSFLALNCGALPEGTLESELFGHEKGAFTGATSMHAGHFERADGGTLFLDEIGEISPSVQIRLLRVLETGEFQRMGGVRPLKSDVRLLAATNRNLELEVREGRFRRDLLHRIKVFEIRLPSLRERREDIPLLVEHFIRETHEKEGTEIREVDPQLMEVLSEAPWPGNIRELRNVVQRMCVLAEGKRLSLRDLPDAFLRSEESSPANLPIPLGLKPEEAERELLYRSLLSLKEDVQDVLGILRSFQEQMMGDPDLPPPSLREIGRDLSRNEESMSLEDMEKEMIRRALQENNGHRRKAAEVLGISERTLYRKIREYGLLS
ncbi:MAG: sigma-54 dependent transcriptional regulator [Candidatus Krumholzibacteria bacterium]|nr:sigma-54 dependent transcriptional regulator [Candidatus Krumholzibacteria bacterium]MDP6796605.1 sigma-54 dependent transcriptional regulator [Candidatus Krumholzibacteria bacterium]